MRYIPLCGQETERQIIAPGIADPESIRRLVHRLLDHLRQHHPHLPDSSGKGIFLSCGSRLYEDRRVFLESSSRECANPDELVRVNRHLEYLIDDARNAVDPQLRIFNSGVDYSTGRSWGTHLNHSYRAGARNRVHRFYGPLASLLVCQLPLAGSGGLDVDKWRFRFVLSPRGCLIRKLYSRSSSTNRGLLDVYHDDDAPPGPLRRLHILCGDGLQSVPQDALRIGIQMCFLQCIEAGVSFPRELRLADPLASFHAVNRDPTLKTEVCLQSGERLSVFELNEHCLEFVERGLDRLPGFAAETVERWRSCLKQLKRGCHDKSVPLDWHVMQHLYRVRAEQLNMKDIWEAAPRVDAVMVELVRLSRRGADRPPEISTSVCARLRHQEPHIFAEILGRQQLHYEELLAAIKLRSELWAVRMLYNEVGSNSLFATVDQQWGGALSCFRRPPEPGPAMAQPARVRAEFVRNHSGQRGYACDWHTLESPKGKRTILVQPERTVARQRTGTMARDSGQRKLLTSLLREYDAGDYRAANRIRQQYLELGFPLEPEYLRHSAWVHARRGEPLRALEYLDELSSRTTKIPDSGQRVLIWRYAGLAPPAAQMLRQLDLAEKLLREDQRTAGLLAAVRGHQAHYLATTGNDLRGAQRCMDEALAAAPSRFPRLHVRLLLDAAEIYQRLVQGEAAARLFLHQARDMAARHGYSGDAALATLSEAKLTASFDLRRTLLAQAARRLKDRDVLGWMRCALLQARLLGTSGRSARAQLQQAAQTCPALMACWLLKDIFKHWDDFVGGQPGPPDRGDPWWLL